MTPNRHDEISPQPASHRMPSGGDFVSDLGNHISVIRYACSRQDLAKNGIGSWLCEHNVYATGNDFTSPQAQDPDYEGDSTLKKLWTGQPSILQKSLNQAQLFVLVQRGKPLGVVAWLHAGSPTIAGIDYFAKTPKHPNHHPKEKVATFHLGHIMAFVKPQIRRQGYVSRIFKEQLLPDIMERAQLAAKMDVTPLLGGSDAMEGMLKRHTPLPITHELWQCRAMRDGLWRLIEKKRMNPELKRPSDPYLLGMSSYLAPKKGLRR